MSGFLHKGGRWRRRGNGGGGNKIKIQNARA